MKLGRCCPVELTLGTAQNGETSQLTSGNFLTVASHRLRPSFLGHFYQLLKFLNILLNKPIDLQKQHIKSYWKLSFTVDLPNEHGDIPSIPSIPRFGFNNVLAWDPIRRLARKMPLAARPMVRGLQFLPNRWHGGLPSMWIESPHTVFFFKIRNWHELTWIDHQSCGWKKKPHWDFTINFNRDLSDIWMLHGFFRMIHPQGPETHDWPDFGYTRFGPR